MWKKHLTINYSGIGNAKNSRVPLAGLPEIVK